MPTPRSLTFSLGLALTLATPVLHAQAPDEIESLKFSGPDITPCPACLSAAPTGELFVGVDLLGSLGKGPGKGRIVRLVDADGDGKPESHTVYANLDNPRGLISVGTKLYVLHTVIPESTGKLEAMHLSVLEDNNWDGIADGPPKILVSDVSPPKHNQDRGADHTTNGIRMGIDGWIYIAVGDFGIHGAKGTDGTELTMLGGGIVRVRPDGSEMEVYTHGLRNIYDMAIDPLMNVYTRGNTNDGGGWNVRFIHQIQSGEYGYPVLFKNFTDEIIPALVDLGGGSGTGALFFQEPGWPEKYNNVPMMCDWGRSQLVIHRVTEDGPSFTQEPEVFIKLSQISDVDVDASGRLYGAAWDGAGYKGNPGKGYVQRYVPKGWSYKAFPTPAKQPSQTLVALLRSESATARLAASQELLNRPKEANAVAIVAADKSASLESRVAAIFTYKQMIGAKANAGLLKLAADPAVQEWSLRAMTDRKTQLDGLAKEPFVAALQSKSPRIQVAAAASLGRLGDPSAAPALLAVTTRPGTTVQPTSEAPKPPKPPAFQSPKIQKEGPHATPNPDIILPHIAVKSLVDLSAAEACAKAVSGPNEHGALWALRKMHSAAAVDGLIASYGSANSSSTRIGILEALIRLYNIEAPYDGSWWWSTRPDTRGPYYKMIKWSESDKIEAFVRKAWESGEGSVRSSIAQAVTKTRAGLSGMEAKAVAATPIKPADPTIDLAKIASKKGYIGKTSIEDVILSLGKVKGDPKLGMKIFTSQGCIACHTTDKNQAPKGPFMGQVGAILTPDQIAESILKPNASISQGFATVMIETKAGKFVTGFITAETADQIEMRDIASQVHIIKTKDVKKKAELETSMMPPGLANSLSLDEFAALVAYLAAQKG